MKLLGRTNEDDIRSNFHSGLHVTVYRHGGLEPVETYEFKTDDEGFMSVTFGRDTGQDISLPHDTTVDRLHGTLYLQKHAVVEGYDGMAPGGKKREQRGTIADTLFLRERSQKGTFLYVPHVHHNQHPKRLLHDGDYALETVTDVRRTKTYLFPGLPKKDSWELSEQFAYDTEYSLGLTFLQKP